MRTFSTSEHQKRLNNLSVLHFWLGNVLRAATACTFSTSERQKEVQTCQFFTLLTWKCASRHNGVHFFTLLTSKSALNVVCPVHFDLEMCFAPQRRALSQPHNFQKWSENGVLCTFWLENVLRATRACTFLTSASPKMSEVGVVCTFWLGNVLHATTACTFCTSQLPSLLRTYSVFSFFTSKCASHHNGVQFACLIWPHGSAPAAFASLLFDPPDRQIIGKHSGSRLSYLFVHLHLLSSLSFSSLIFSLLLFSSLTLPTSAFPTVHIVGSFTSSFDYIFCLLYILYTYIYICLGYIYIYKYTPQPAIFMGIFWWYRGTSQEHWEYTPTDRSDEGDLVAYP